MSSLIWSIAIVATVALFSFWMVWKRKKNTASSSSRLGIRTDLPLGELADRLEAAFPPEFEVRLKQRSVLVYPTMTEYEFQWRLLELKRFFIMTAILNRVPMFSKTVDQIWHEMLSFTAEYERFGHSFVGYVIQHVPRSVPKAMPGERAWFDWIYAQLFQPAPFSDKAWGAFFRFPLTQDSIETLEEAKGTEQRSRLFNSRAMMNSPQISQTVEILVSRAREQIANARRIIAKRNRRPSSLTQEFQALAKAMIFYSILDPKQYGRSMHDIKSPGPGAGNIDLSTSWCIGSFGESGNSGD